MKNGPVQVTFSSDVSGGIVRYTMDGAEPQVSSPSYDGTALTINSSTVLRARVFLPGALPGEIATATYLIGEPSWVGELPVVSLSGKDSEVFFAPYGIFGKSGGSVEPGTGWVADLQTDYYLSRDRGRHTERPIQMEWFARTGERLFQTRAGVRMSASTASRPNMRLDQLEGPWSTRDWRNKPSLNVFFRGDYEGDLDYPLFGQDGPQEFDSLRFRAGKNDIDAPFIVDELTRRLTAAIGQPNSLGGFVLLFVNGTFRGYYNVCQRLQEPFFQRAYCSEERWDVIQGQAPQQTAPNPPYLVEEGDADAFGEMLAWFRDADLSDSQNYEEALTYLDVVNFIDYLIPSLWAATLDWHLNNWVAAKERSENGIWRFYVWDVTQNPKVDLNRIASQSALPSCELASAD